MNINCFTRIVYFLALGGLSFSMLGCSTGKRLEANVEPTIHPSSSLGTDVDLADEETRSLGALMLTANGEAFIQEGFVSRDGWSIVFDHVYLTVSDVVVSQVSSVASNNDDPTPSAKQDAQSSDREGPIQVAFAANPITIDLVNQPMGNALVESKDVPIGYYNAMDWSIVSPTEESLGEEFSQVSQSISSGLQLIGQATKGGQSIPFVLSLAPHYRYSCGAFIGERRKGFVTEGQKGAVEMTIHIDHVFGDGLLPADDAVNLDALGFEPLRAIAQSQPLDSPLFKADQSFLKTHLSAENYKRLEDALQGLGHVGEGHCSISPLSDGTK